MNERILRDAMIAAREAVRRKPDTFYGTRKNLESGRRHAKQQVILARQIGRLWKRITGS